jgi:hypothetical protein
MKIHEYQGKEILKKYGVSVPKGEVAFTIDEAVKAAEKIGGSVWVVKAQRCEASTKFRRSPRTRRRNSRDASYDTSNRTRRAYRSEGSR